jgi:hypothetical protein
MGYYISGMGSIGSIEVAAVVAMLRYGDLDTAMKLVCMSIVMRERRKSETCQWPLNIVPR